MRRFINCSLGAAALLLLTVPPLGAAEGTLRAVATIPAAHSVLSAILGEAGEAHLLIRGAASPHTYSLKPSDAQALADADLVVWVGPGLETFLEGRMETLAPHARIVTWESLPGIQRHDVRDGGEWDAHDHDHDHDHAKHDDHGEAGHDPHLWLDPGNATLLASVLAEALAASAPDRKADFAAAAQAYEARLAGLDAELRAQLAPLKGRRFLVFHDAYQYFERHYGLAGAGSVTISPEVSPGAARVREIRSRIVDGGVVCVFAEPQFRPDLVTTLVDGTAASAAVLDPVGANLEPGPDLYPQLLEGLAGSMTACLAPRN